MSEEWGRLNLNCAQCCGAVEEEQFNSIVIEQQSAHMRQLSGRGSIRKDSRPNSGATLDSARMNNSIRVKGGARPASQHEGDMSSIMNMSILSDSYVTREFNQAFKFLQTKAEKVNADDDAVDSNLKRLLSDMME